MLYLSPDHDSFSIQRVLLLLLSPQHALWVCVALDGSQKDSPFQEMKWGVGLMKCMSRIHTPNNSRINQDLLNVRQKEKGMGK